MLHSHILPASVFFFFFPSICLFLLVTWHLIIRLNQCPIKVCLYFSVFFVYVNDLIFCWCVNCLFNCYLSCEPKVYMFSVCPRLTQCSCVNQNGEAHSWSLALYCNLLTVNPVSPLPSHVLMLVLPTLLNLRSVFHFLLPKSVPLVGRLNLYCKSNLQHICLFTTTLKIKSKFFNLSNHNYLIDKITCWLNCKESACNPGGVALIPELERCPGEGNGNPLQHSFLENPMGGGPCQAVVHGLQRVRHNWATKQQQQLFNSHTTFHLSPHVHDDLAKCFTLICSKSTSSSLLPSPVSCLLLIFQVSTKCLFPWENTTVPVILSRFFSFPPCLYFDISFIKGHALYLYMHFGFMSYQFPPLLSFLSLMQSVTSFSVQNLVHI